MVFSRKGGGSPMEKTILNFHCDYLNTSLKDFDDVTPIQDDGRVVREGGDVRGLCRWTIVETIVVQLLFQESFS